MMLNKCDFDYKIKECSLVIFPDLVWFFFKSVPNFLVSCSIDSFIY